MQTSPYQCDNDFSRLQEEKIFGQLNPGNGIETDCRLSSGHPCMIANQECREPGYLVPSPDPQHSVNPTALPDFWL
ncbi:MAG: hypothetical protein KME26_08125 [Oscillatoria princeps RMCB-10]|nr:hypothetical protein [Oscillatoria princeps RMCB-10]